MAIENWINVGGLWKEISEKWLNVGGIWKQVDVTWQNIGGTWKKVYEALVAISAVTLTNDTGNSNFCSSVGSCTAGPVSCGLGPAIVTGGDQTPAGYTYLWTKVSGNVINTGSMTGANIGYSISSSSYADGEQVSRSGTFNLKITDTTGNATSSNYSMSCSAGNSGS